MLSIKRKVLMPAVAAVIALSLQACSSGNPNISHLEYMPVSNGFIEETILEKEDSGEAEVVRSNMTKMLSNEYAELYIGEAYDIALIDTRTGKVWYSNEDIYGEEIANYTAEQKKYAYSQVIIDYYIDGVNPTLSSYPDCYDGENMNQVTFEVNEEVLSVHYAFGYDLEKMVVFENISSELFEEMEKVAQAGIEAGTVSRAAWGRAEGLYSPVSGKNYYALRADMGVYELKRLSQLFNQMGYTEDDVRAEKEKLNGAISTQNTAPAFEITLNYSLDGADLMVWVDMSEIYEPEDNYLGRVTVLPGFGANTTSDEGYMIFSDGTLINNGTTDAGERVPVGFYGNDEALEERLVSNLKVTTPFPVYGISTGNAAVFAIVESGESISGVDIMRSNSMYGRNMVAPWFNYHIERSNYVGNSDTAIKMYPKVAMEQPYVVRYHFLYDTRASYNGMADYYRSYLVTTDGLQESEEGSKWYEDVNIVGSISGTKNIMGISFESVLSASDYESVKKWIADTGMEQQISINYEGIFNGGVDGKSPLKLKTVSSLGSKDELEELLSKESVYPVLSMQTVAESGNGIRKSEDFARTVSKKYVAIATYNLATGRKMETEKNSFLISPLSYEKVVSGMVNAYKKYNNNQILLKDAASLLYSDFNSGGGSTREESKLYLCDALAQLKAAGLSLKLDGVNAYALKYGTAFTNIKTDSKLTEYADSQIPFIGLVLHGLVSYSVEPLNEASCYEEAVLNMIEYGANPGWRIITGAMSILDNTDYACYYSASADAWTDDIKALNEKVQDFYTSTAKEVIIDHSILSNGLVRVTYSNGYQAYINRTNETLRDGSISVESHSFYLCNEEGIEQ